MTKRLREIVTCELLLLVNFPIWMPVLPVYLMSYVVDNPSPLLRHAGSVVRSIRGAIYRSFGLRILATRPFGHLRFYCDLDGVYHIATEFLKGESLGLISPRDKVFLDIGAHYGLVSARIASMLPRSLQVIAIEAHPVNYSALKSNIELNQLTNVKAFNFAIANFTGTTHMQAHDGISTHYKLTDRELNADSPLEVQCYTLPDVVARLGIEHVDLVKLDIEGLELKVLQTCFPSLTGRVGKLDIEVHHLADVGPIRNLLISNGFAVQIKRWGILSESYRVIAEKTSLA
jgi:FkbM family methyltransferase